MDKVWGGRIGYRNRVSGPSIGEGVEGTEHGGVGWEQSIKYGERNMGQREQNLGEGEGRSGGPCQRWT